MILPFTMAEPTQSYCSECIMNPYLNSYNIMCKEKEFRLFIFQPVFLAFWYDLKGEKQYKNHGLQFVILINLS